VTGGTNVIHTSGSRILAAGITAAVLLSGSAYAAIVTFSGIDVGANGRPIPNSDAAAANFDTAAAALGTKSIITFESAPLGSFTNLLVAPGVTINGTDFLGSPQTISNLTACTGALCGTNTTVGGSKFLFVNGGSVTFTFATPISFFGAYLGGVQLDGETINFNDGSSQSLIYPNPSSSVGGIEFFGFTDAGKSISSIQIQTINPSNSSGDFISVDDVRYQTAAVSGVPEPATLASVTFAIAALGLLRRKFRKN
jgi:hypothetical protein